VLTHVVEPIVFHGFCLRCASSWAPSCAPARRASGLLAPEVGGSLCPQLCPELCLPSSARPRAASLLVAGSQGRWLAVSPAVPPALVPAVPRAVPPRGEPMGCWLSRSVARCAPSCAPAQRAYGLLAPRIGGSLGSQLCPELCPCAESLWVAGSQDSSAAMKLPFMFFEETLTGLLL